MRCRLRTNITGEPSVARNNWAREPPDSTIGLVTMLVMEPIIVGPLVAAAVIIATTAITAVVETRRARVTAPAWVRA